MMPRISELSSKSGIVIVNQHGDNRGDEAAMRAMVRQLAVAFPEDRFTVVHQFADPHSEVELDVPVDYLPLRIPIVEAARLATYAVVTALGLPASWLLGRHGRDLVLRYRQARLVISAPGGPYFGDLYAGHELVHWFYVWLAKVLGRPLFLYAPSAGPFRNALLNPVRRRGYRWFDRVALRDGVSAGYLRDLMGEDFPLEITADSALQDPFPTTDPESDTRSRPLLVIAVRDPGPGAREDHDTAVVKAIEAVSAQYPSDVVFLPQLHGPRHRDRPYLNDIANRITNAASVTVEDDLGLDSGDHRRIVAAADLVIAGRYHPAVFAVAAATPVVVIAYEHKSQGLAQMAGIQEWAVEVAEATGDRLADLATQVLAKSEEISSTLKTKRKMLQAAARRSTEMAIEVVEDRR